MVQYIVFLIIWPIAFVGALSALLLPRFVHSYRRFAWLRVYNYKQLMFLVINLVEPLTHDRSLKMNLAAVDYLFIGSGPSVWLLFSVSIPV